MMTLSQIQLITREWDRMEAAREASFLDAISTSVHSLFDKDAGKTLQKMRKAALKRIQARDPKDTESNIKEMTQTLMGAGVKVLPMPKN